MEWINVKDRLPPQGIHIRIKAHNGYDIAETTSVFTIYDVDEDTEAWGWSMDKEDQEKYGTLRPTHWMPLPPPPKTEGL